MELRVPLDPTYTARLGAAVYAFAYYEWIIIYLIEQFRDGFVAQYCRGGPMTSGDVRKVLESIVDEPASVFTMVSRTELQSCCTRFASLIDQRNALIHAHPITDLDGEQILYYQARVDRPLSELKWPIDAVNKVLQEFDAAAVEASELLYRFLQSSQDDDV